MTQRLRYENATITVRSTRGNQIAAFLDVGTMEAQRILGTCSIYDRPGQIKFIREWRTYAIHNYIDFELSYELEYLLALDTNLMVTSGESTRSAFSPNEKGF